MQLCFFERFFFTHQCQPYNPHHFPRPPFLPPKPQRIRKPRPQSSFNYKLFNGNMEAFIQVLAHLCLLSVHELHCLSSSTGWWWGWFFCLYSLFHLISHFPPAQCFVFTASQPERAKAKTCLCPNVNQNREAPLTLMQKETVDSLFPTLPQMGNKQDSGRKVQNMVVRPE